MKKTIIGIVVVIVIIVAWMALRRPSESAEDQAAAAASGATSTGAWISIESATVNKVDASGKVVKTYATGDAVMSGDIIKSDATGAANIYFADGSSLRLDPSSSLTITESEYSEKDGSLRVRVTLQGGKVWSKIVALTTPESHWEVKSGSAVATVRGSAFGMEVTATSTDIVGSEHDVTVTPLDPATGQPLEGSEVKVKESESLTLTPKQIEALKKLKTDERKKQTDKLLSRIDKAKDTKHADWVKVNEKADVELRAKIEELKKEGKSPAEIRKLLHERLIQLKRDRPMPPKTVTPTTRPATNTTKPTANTTNTTNTTTKPEPKVLSIRIINKSGTLKAVEGSTLTFAAEAKLSDGTTKDVTSVVTWKVLGSIGSINASGVFVATLGADVSEMGRAAGAVVAIWRNAAGLELLGKTEIINVEAAAASEEEQRG